MPAKVHTDAHDDQSRPVSSSQMLSICRVPACLCHRFAGVALPLGCRPPRRQHTPAVPLAPALPQERRLQRTPHAAAETRRRPISCFGWAQCAIWAFSACSPARRYWRLPQDGTLTNDRSVQRPDLLLLGTACFSVGLPGAPRPADRALLQGRSHRGTLGLQQPPPRCMIVPGAPRLGDTRRNQVSDKACRRVD